MAEPEVGTSKKLSNVQTVAPALIAIVGTLATTNPWLAGIALVGAISIAGLNIRYQYLLDKNKQ